jgi:hypothetical protein
MRDQTEGDTDTSRPCSIQVYQVTLMPQSWATSSRRSPGVRRRMPSGRPAIWGVMRERALRTNSPSAWRRRGEPA